MKTTSLALTALTTASLLLNARADITTGLVGYWNLSDGPGASTANDLSGSGNIGTLKNYTDGTYNNMWTTSTDPTNGWPYALMFTNSAAGLGANTYVNVPDSTSLNTPTANKAWTLAAWIYPTVAGASQTNNAGIISKGYSGAEAYAMYLSGGKVTGVLRNSANNGNETVSGNTVLAANTWYHVAVTVLEPKGSANAEVIIYVNGVLDSGANANTYTTDYSSSQPVTIGARMNGSGTVNLPFLGTIDEARIYNRALSSSDILQLYQNKAFTVLNSGVGSWNGLAGSGGNATLDSTSLNFCTNVYSVPVGTAASLTSVLNLESANALQLGGIFADTYYSSSKQNSVGATNLTIAAGGVSFATATAAGSLTFLNAATTYILNSSDSIGLKDNGANATSLVQGGSGTVILTGVNTFSGGVTINSGTVQLGNGVAITGNELGTATTVNDNGTLAFNGNNSLSFAGTIAGTGAVTQKGAGTLTLSTGNTYSGGTTIAGSTVSAASLTDSGSSLGTGPVNLNNGTLLYTGPGDSTARQFNGTSGTTNVIDVPSGVTLDLSGRVTGSAAWYVNKNDTGTLTLSGAGDNSYLGMSVNAGTVILNKSSTAGVHAIGEALNVASGATVQMGVSGTTAEIYSNSVAPVTISSGGVFDANGQNENFYSLSLSGTGIGGTGALVNSASGSISTLTVPITLAANTTIGGVGSITLPSVVSGSNTLTYSGLALLSLAATNTYTGGSVVTAGTLDVSATGFIPGNVTVSGTGVLELDNNNALSSIATLTLPSSPAAGTVNLGFSGTQVIGVLMLGSTVQPAGTYGAVGSGATYTSATFTGGGILSVTGTAYWDASLLNAVPGGGGSGNWDTSTASWFNGSADASWPLDALATFAGSAGTVTLAASVGANELTFATPGYVLNNTDGTSVLTLDNNTPTINVPTGNTTITCTVAESGAGPVTVNGSGTLTLSGANTFAGGTIINSATVVANTIADANCSIGPSGTVTFLGGGGLTYSGGGPAGTSRTVTANGTNTAYLNVPSGTLTLSGQVKAGVGNTGQNFTKTGIGTLILGGTTDNSALAMAINAGQVIITKTSGSSVHGLGGGTSMIASGASLQLAGSGNSDLYTGCILNISAGGFLDLNSQSDIMSTLTLSGTGSGNGALINSTTTAISYLTNNGSGFVLAGPTTIGGPGSIFLGSAVSGSYALTYAGTGTLTLGAAGTYSGGTIINPGGTVQLNSQTAAGTGTIADNGTLAVNIAGNTLTNTITGGSSSIINFIETSGQNSTLNGPMSGFSGTINCPVSPGSTAKAQISSNCNLPATATNNVAAGGTLFLTTGTTNAATVILNGVGNSEVYGAFRLDTAAQTGPVILQTNSTIGSGNANGGVISGVISAGGHGYGFVKTANANPITLLATNTFSGAITISNGVLAIGGAGQLGSGNYAAPITNYGTFTYASSAPQTLSGVIFGTGTLLQSGPGVLTLSGANTYTGGTLITNGSTLAVSGAGCLGVTPTATNYASGITNYGTLAYNSSAAQTLSGVISGSGALVQSGSSALTLSGANTYTGATVITNGGTLVLGSGGSINGTPSIGIAAGSTLDVTAYSSYAMLAGITLKASGTATTSATIKGTSPNGTVTLNGPMTLSFTPQTFNGDATHPALLISQISAGQLVLDGNAITVINAGASPLGAGTYSLIQVPPGGSISAGSPTVTVTGNGLAAGATASISVSGGSVNLVVTGGAPVPGINSIALVDGSLVFSGANGPNSHTYYVLGSSNVTLPLSLWTPIETNTFSPTGGFTVTNAIGVGPWRFFIIQYSLP
jgi:autotransporter-associated beta strand protein